MTIRRLLIGVLTLFGLVVLAGAFWEFTQVQAKLRAVVWVEGANRVADLSLRTSSRMAMERGIVAAMLSGSSPLSSLMREEMSRQRASVDLYYRQLLDAAERLPVPSGHPVSVSLHALARSRGELESMRQRIDGGAVDVDEETWIALSTRHIEALADLRRATMAPLPDNIYLHTPNPVIKEALFTASEHAGRERAVIGSVIMQGRPFTDGERARLEQFRNITEVALGRVASILAQSPATPELTRAATGLTSGFLGRYEALRAAVYQASEQGRPYPVGPVEWFAAATEGIDSILALADEVSAMQRRDIAQLRRNAGIGSLLALGSFMFATVLIIVTAYVVRRRLLEPLDHLQAAADRIAAGDLDQSLREFAGDELGVLAQAFERMRRTLLADITRREADAAELRKFKAAIEQAADTVIITDRARTIEYVNLAFERTRGFRRDEVIGCNASMLKNEHNDPATYTEFQQALKRGEVYRATLTNRRADGGLYCEEITVSPVRDTAGNITHFVSNGKDVTDRVKAERELQKLSRVIEQSVSAVIITDSQGIIEYVNPQFTRTTGYTLEEARGQKPSLLKSGRTPPEQYHELWRTISQGRVWEGEMINRRKGGELYWDLVSISPVRDERGVVTHFVGLQHDVSERKRLEERLNFLAYYDDLTQLPNRALLAQRFEQIVEANPPGGLVALLSLDLAHFKLINDSLGHRAGDEVLRVVGQRLTDVARGRDTVARFGGDEFVVILSGVERVDDVSAVAQRMIDAVTQPVPFEGQDLNLNVHVGISLMPQDGSDLDALLQNAVTALHQAAREGRNRFRFYTDELNALAQQRLSLEHALRHALERGELELHYQPKVAFSDGRIVGVEALARWHRPDEGWISPQRFIPVAEESGLILSLGEWALREACWQGRAWQDAGLPPLSMAVNLSAHQLCEPGLLDRVRGVLEDTGFPAAQLELELTESAVMDNPEQTAEVLRGLKALGVTLAIDDFGTGYSSLSHLGRFPFDTLKIDRGFVVDITDQTEHAVIAVTIIAMADSLRLKVVAEGVENEAQALYLRAEGCDELQGYLFSPAVPAAELERLLREGRHLHLPS